jgi:hypothetical protein
MIAIHKVRYFIQYLRFIASQFISCVRCDIWSVKHGFTMDFDSRLSYYRPVSWDHYKRSSPYRIVVSNIMWLVPYDQFEYNVALFKRSYK